MKAYNVMMLLLIFNLCLSITDILNIWEIGYGFYSVESFEAFVTGPLLYISIIGILAALGGAAAVSYFVPQGQQSIIYIVFSVVFWILWGNTMAVVTSLMATFGAALILGVVFTIIMIPIWLAGISQMVTGPWGGQV